MGCFSMPKGVPNKRYTPEFKKQVVETMYREKLSIREVSIQFEIGDHNAVARWERIYLLEGPEGLAVERRGRGSKGRPQQFSKEVEEEFEYTSIEPDEATARLELQKLNDEIFNETENSKVLEFSGKSIVFSRLSRESNGKITIDKHGFVIYK